MNEIQFQTNEWVDATPRTEQEWIGKLEKLKAIELIAGWKFAECLQWGVREYSLTVEDIAYQVNYAPHTLTNILSVMNNTAAPIARGLGLSVSHAVAVLGLDEEEKAALLTEAAENSWGADKLRYVARGQRMTNLLSAGGNLTGSAPLNDKLFNVETYQDDEGDGSAPVLSSHPYPELAEGDDVPFSHVPLSIEIVPPVKAYEVAEYIVGKWGKAFAAEVAGEVARWW